ncbi:MAG TPA: translation initiation factor IF-2 subunit alpha [Candidatus Norongarragalinales archaeon]|jgi:translation initiation factor 2 subunit 1|nr:translation initiation factor IF-2 subunit alpha [Candidatus Norongarragalinales archaeon]
MVQPYPEIHEFVIATVRKVMPYGAFCALEEYNGLEAFVHISEVSSGWIRNIRDHVKEGQKIVAEVIRIDQEKHQIDLSLKRVSEADKKRKIESHSNEKRAVKLLERAALKMGKKMDAAMKEAGAPLTEEFGTLYDAFEKISQGTAPAAKISEKWLAAITDIAKAEIKPKEINMRGILTLSSTAPNGIELVKNTLVKIQKMPSKAKILVHYIGAPTYYIDISAGDFKTADKTLDKISLMIQETAKKESMEFALEKQKG